MQGSVKFPYNVCMCVCVYTYIHVWPTTLEQAKVKEQTTWCVIHSYNISSACVEPSVFCSS